MANSRIGGFIQFQVNGEKFSARGNFAYNIGVDKKEMFVGADGVHGYTQKPQVSFIEGAITDNNELDLRALQETVDATVTLTLANGKAIVLQNAVYAGDGNASSEEGEIEIRFEGFNAREVA